MGSETQPAKLCLNMIVKNEAANIERCLRSVAGSIACWVIGDTGSSDGTPELIERFFQARGIPGELHRFPFETFDQARNEALTRARASNLAFDYLLLTDADMELKVVDQRFPRRLTEAAYLVRQTAGITYLNIRLVKRDAPARYRGVTHEYLNILEGRSELLEEISFIDHATGSSRVVKYERDCRLLTDALTTESDPALLARYTFYLAQSYRDGGQHQKALDAYLARADLGHWDQEVFFSLYQAGKLMEALVSRREETIAIYQRATDFCPTRAEAAHAASRLCRNAGDFARGHAIARSAIDLPAPIDGLFVESWIYDYGALDEFAVNAYWAGAYRDCLDASLRAIESGKAPAADQRRFAQNARFALSKMPVGET